MPVIREYVAERATRGFDPTNRGASEIANAGRRISAMSYESGQMVARAAANQGRALGDIGEGIAAVGKAGTNYLENQDVMKFHAGEAELINHMTHAWNKVRTEADPNDPDVATKFNQDVLSPALEQFGTQFQTEKGQELAASFGARFREHMFTRQSADAATAAGAAVVENLDKVSNNNAAALNADPSQLDLVQQNTNSMIENYKHSNPNLTAEQTAHIDELGRKMRTGNVVAAFHGMAKSNPAAAQAALDAGFGGDDLSATERATLGNVAKAQESFNRERDNAAKAEARREEADAANTAANKLLAENLDPTTGTIVASPKYFEGVRDLAEKHPTSEAWKGMYQVGQKANADEVAHRFQATDPHTAEDFNARATLPADDPNALKLEDVDRAYVASLLSKADQAAYRNLITDLSKDPQKRDALNQFNKFVQSQKSSITRSSLFSGFDPGGDQEYGRFIYDKRQQFEQAYKNGSWKETLDPRNPKFLGTDIRGYQIDNKEALQRLMNTQRTGHVGPVTHAAPRAEGESIDAYKKRTGQ